MEFDKSRVHRIVEYLKFINFDADYFDLVNSDIDDVLKKYGISICLTNQEKGEIFKELLHLVEENKFREIEKLVRKEINSMISKENCEVK